MSKEMGGLATLLENGDGSSGVAFAGPEPAPVEEPGALSDLVRFFAGSHDPRTLASSMAARKHNTKKRKTWRPLPDRVEGPLKIV